MTLLERDREKIEQGKKQEKLQIAINLLDILEDDIIAEKTGLSIEEVKELRKSFPLILDRRDKDFTSFKYKEIKIED